MADHTYLMALALHMDFCGRKAQILRRCFSSQCDGVFLFLTILVGGRKKSKITRK